MTALQKLLDSYRAASLSEREKGTYCVAAKRPHTINDLHGLWWGRGYVLSAFFHLFSRYCFECGCLVDFIPLGRYSLNWARHCVHHELNSRSGYWTHRHFFESAHKLRQLGRLYTGVVRGA